VVLGVVAGSIWPAGVVAAAASTVTPADGRLRGPNFAAMVTSVTWPSQATVGSRAADAPPGKRFVQFALNLDLDTDGIPAGGRLPITATVTWAGRSRELDLSPIANEILGAGPGTGWQSGSGQFTEAVSNTSHQVDLELSEGSFSQTLNLWTLKRVPPVPLVLYRDPNRPTLAAAGSSATSLGLSNPADGFTSSASVSVQSATLGYFAPSGVSSLMPNANQAVLSVVLDGEFPSNPDDPTATGHYLGSQAPLPPSMVTFSPSRDAAVPATLSDAGDNSGKGKNDDGLFDATYSFLVSASLTTGSINVAAGSFSGAEFTLFTAETGNTSIDVTAPASLPVTFPAVPIAGVQRTPPWVGQPLPATASSAYPGSPSGSGSGGFPVWLAVLIVALLAVAVVAAQRLRRSRQRTVQAATAGHGDVEPRVTEPDVTAAAASPSFSPEPEVEAPEPIVVAAAGSSGSEEPEVKVLGPVEVSGLRRRSDRRIVEELLVYLVCHDHRHLRVGQLQLGMRPAGSSRGDVQEKTLRNYLSELRGCVGADHLPEATGREGYKVEGVASDWANFQALARQADTIDKDTAIELRTQALEMVRGRPFDGSLDTYEWVGEEHLDTQMLVAIVQCALRVAEDHLEAGHPEAAERAIRMAQKATWEDYDLWRVGARSFKVRGDRTGLQRWLADASRHLEPEDIARIEAELEEFPDEPPHDEDQS
jgi:DNA-binding SARP family transcriptional activator